MKAYEHRAIGDDATSGALVNLGGESDYERFVLSFGDVVALSGDFFRPLGGPVSALGYSQGAGHDAGASGRLFDLAVVPGDLGTRADSRDEMVCALKVATLDEAVEDPRFEPGGRFADFRFSAGADSTEVERRVRDRYLTLAANNDDHFVAPGWSDAATGSGFPSAVVAYRRLHRMAWKRRGFSDFDVATSPGRWPGRPPHSII